MLKNGHLPLSYSKLKSQRADGGSNGPRDDQRSRWWRAQSLTCADIRDFLQLSRQVLGCWNMEDLAECRLCSSGLQWWKTSTNCPGAFWTNCSLLTSCCGKPKSTVLPESRHESNKATMSDFSTGCVIDCQIFLIRWSSPKQLAVVQRTCSHG